MFEAIPFTDLYTQTICLICLFKCRDDTIPLRRSLQAFSESSGERSILAF